MFDWGAKEAEALMRLPGFGIEEAASKLQCEYYMLVT
jgi:hypothetical protein